MKSRVISIIAVGMLLLSLIALTGCRNKENKKDEESEIVGTWKSDQYNVTYNFNKNHTGSYIVLDNEVNFLYEETEAKLKLYFDKNSEIVIEYDYSINDGVLKLTDVTGTTTELKKK